jgi:hypothetical protein
MLGAIAFACLVGGQSTAPAWAASRNSLKLTAPGTTTAGEAFPVHLSGFVVAPADVLTYYVSKAGCPAAFHTANSVGNVGGSLQLHPGKHGRKFSETVEPSETTPATYNICAYLIHGKRTYARATGKTETVA